MHFSNIVAGLMFVLLPFSTRAGIDSLSQSDAGLHSTASRTILFSGLEWTVKTGPGLLGPGPNYFTDSPEVVWVDSLGLHLRIVNYEGLWYCSEVSLNQSLGHGEYRFYVQSRLDTLDPMVAVGFFTWDQEAPEYNHREIDIEFCRCTVPAGGGAQYTIQPWDTEGNLHRFHLNADGPTTHMFKWCSSQIDFKSLGGDSVLYSWSYTGDDNPPPGDEKVRINLWLVWGQPPLNGKPVELVVSGFSFCPVDEGCSVDSGGCIGFAGPHGFQPGPDIPSLQTLYQNYPNPFDPHTTIEFDLVEKGPVSLKIYDVGGRLVRTLFQGERDSGTQKLTWDGKDDRGRVVASGTYFYRLETDRSRQTKRAILVR